MAISLVRWSLIFYAKVLFSVAMSPTKRLSSLSEQQSQQPCSRHRHLICTDVTLIDGTLKRRVVRWCLAHNTNTSLAHSLTNTGLALLCRGSSALSRVPRSLSLFDCCHLLMIDSLSFSLLHYCLGSDPFFSKQPFSNPRQHTFVHRLHFFTSVSPHCALFGYLSWPVRPNRSCDHRRYCAVVFG